MSNVRNFGAIGDGRRDDTAALQHAIDDGDGCLELPRGEYRITRPLVVDVGKSGRTAIHGSGGTAKLIMQGPGPAISLVGNHGGTADPKDFQPAVWQRERMPTLSQLEIEGAHPEADGVRIEGVMQPTLTGLLIRRVRHGVQLAKRNRNVLISHCHIYHNTGCGVFFDHVNLHQTIITGCHISYGRLGGVRIVGGEIRNLQITGNDIEYNNNRAHKVPDADAEPTAEIFIDLSQGGTVREGTIASNTLQATESPTGANIRVIGNPTEGDHFFGMWSVTGNLIGSQRTNVHLTSVRGVTLTGNYLYSAQHRNLLVENSRNIVVGSNCIGHNPDYRDLELATGLRFENCTNCNLHGVTIEDARAGKHTVKEAAPLVRDGLIELIRCRRVNLTGVQVLAGVPYGVYLEDCDDTLLTGCTIVDDRESRLMKAAVKWRGKGTGNQISSCRLGAGTEGTVVAEPKVTLVDNVL